MKEPSFYGFDRILLLNNVMAVNDPFQKRFYGWLRQWSEAFVRATLHASNVPYLISAFFEGIVCAGVFVYANKNRTKCCVMQFFWFWEYVCDDYRIFINTEHFMAEFVPFKFYFRVTVSQKRFPCVNTVEDSPVNSTSVDIVNKLRNPLVFYKILP